MIDENSAALRKKRLIRIAGFSADFDPEDVKRGEQSEEVKKLWQLFGELRIALDNEDYLGAAEVRDRIYNLRDRLRNSVSEPANQ